MNSQLRLFWRVLPEGLESLAELALDLRWTWSHTSDRLWSMLDQEVWELTRNAQSVLHNVPEERLRALAGDVEFKAELKKVEAARQDYLKRPGWFKQQYSPRALQPVAYFSMEFGLGEALPLYAGGLASWPEMA